MIFKSKLIKFYIGFIYFKWIGSSKDPNEKKTTEQNLTQNPPMSPIFDKKEFSEMDFNLKPEILSCLNDFLSENWNVEHFITKTKEELKKYKEFDLKILCNLTQILEKIEKIAKADSITMSTDEIEIANFLNSSEEDLYKEYIKLSVKLKLFYFARFILLGYNNLNDLSLNAETFMKDFKSYLSLRSAYANVNQLRFLNQLTFLNQYDFFIGKIHYLNRIINNFLNQMSVLKKLMMYTNEQITMFSHLKQEILNDRIIKFYIIYRLNTETAAYLLIEMGVCRPDNIGVFFGLIAIYRTFNN